MSDSAPANFAPVQRGGRIAALDTLRGLAMLGILFANFPSLSIPGTFKSPGVVSDTLSEKLVFAFHSTFIDLKLMTCFAIMFGVGLAMQFEGAERREVETQSTFLFLGWRLSLLAVIGFVHGFAFWYGEILLVYAVCGLASLIFLALPKYVQLALGVSGIVLTAFALLLLGLASLGVPPENFDLLNLQTTVPSSSPNVSDSSWQVAWLNSGQWADYHAWNLRNWLQLIAIELILYSWRIGGLILLGYSLVSFGLFKRTANAQKVWTYILILALPIGLSVEAFLAYKQVSGLNSAGARLVVMGVHHISTTLLSLSYLAIAMKLPESWSLTGFLVGPNRVGQMALTVYLSQSVLHILFFTNFGLGLAGKVSFQDLAIISLGVAASYCAIAILWTKLFRFGPIEWIWRSLTYGKAQAVFRRNA